MTTTRSSAYKDQAQREERVRLRQGDGFASECTFVATRNCLALTS